MDHLFFHDALTGQVQPDLFGGASLIREWGRIGQAGQVRVDPHPDEGCAVDALAGLAQAKRKRGYSRSFD